MQEDFSVHYTYTRSTGPVIGDFLTALRDKKQILGIKGSDGRTLKHITDRRATTGFARPGLPGEMGRR